MVACKGYIFGLEHLVIHIWINSNDSDISPDFDCCFPDISTKIELRIEYDTKVFMLRFNSKFGPVEKHRRMVHSIFSLGVDNLYALFVFVRIKLYLPLAGPIRYDI